MTKPRTTSARRKAAVKATGKLPKVEEAQQLATRIGSLLRKFEATMAKSDAKISVADYIRLVQLKREFEDQQPKDITVTWVDSLKEKNASEE